ncbi:MAG: hypothetical protein A3F17_04305 [Gammaproteobacteria bacterium RIFCSPHIGHO2_12_FULL_41_15]|nr:MAG: hypothetical protein A3F17_04305 [Gammaproteobacteria bacterium RIFCSPHIGHO2_12_FULL_41_15]
MEKRTKAVQLTKIWRSIQSFLLKQQRLFGRISDSSVPLFWFELIANPGQIGACLPSSKTLSNTIAKQVNPNPQGFVLELGGGTGAVTHALLKNGISPGKLIVIERSSAMVRYLRHQFPNVRIIQCNAQDAKTYLQEEWRHISHVVSGLPICSLPKPVVHELIDSLSELVKNGAKYTHFTYKRKNHQMHQVNFMQREKKTYVLRNIPFAMVETFSKVDRNYSA